MAEHDAPRLSVAATDLEYYPVDVFRIPPPGSAETEELTRTTPSAVKCDPKLEWKRAAKKLNGSSAAMVDKSARDAIKVAMLSGKKVVYTHVPPQQSKKIYERTSSLDARKLFRLCRKTWSALPVRRKNSRIFVRPAVFPETCRRLN
ncbi:hypothetical protein [Novipirellula caenicola]|uniref:hypothetical protein n=1 Tax=Novipirellula caenicola TaxID=1536901 RepID=UPI0031EBAB85